MSGTKENGSYSSYTYGRRETESPKPPLQYTDLVGVDLMDKVFTDDRYSTPDSILRNYHALKPDVSDPQPTDAATSGCEMDFPPIPTVKYVHILQDAPTHEGDLSDHISASKKESTHTVSVGTDMDMSGQFEVQAVDGIAQTVDNPDYNSLAESAFAVPNTEAGALKNMNAETCTYTSSVLSADACNMVNIDACSVENDNSLPAMLIAPPNKAPTQRKKRRSRQKNPVRSDTTVLMPIEPAPIRANVFVGPQQGSFRSDAMMAPAPAGATMIMNAPTHAVIEGSFLTSSNLEPQFISSNLEPQFISSNLEPQFINTGSLTGPFISTPFITTGTGIEGPFLTTQNVPGPFITTGTIDGTFINPTNILQGPFLTTGSLDGQFITTGNIEPSYLTAIFVAAPAEEGNNNSQAETANQQLVDTCYSSGENETQSSEMYTSEIEYTINEVCEGEQEQEVQEEEDVSEMGVQMIEYNQEQEPEEDEEDLPCLTELKPLKIAMEGNILTLLDQELPQLSDEEEDDAVTVKSDAETTSDVFSLIDEVNEEETNSQADEDCVSTSPSLSDDITRLTLSQIPKASSLVKKKKKKKKPKTPEIDILNFEEQSSDDDEDYDDGYKIEEDDDDDDDDYDSSVADASKDLSDSEKVANLFKKLETYDPAVPDAVTLNYLSCSGVQVADDHIVRVVALMFQKFVTEVAIDAMHYTDARNEQSAKGSKPPQGQGKEKKKFLSVEDLAAALSEHGINVRKPPYFV